MFRSHFQAKPVFAEAKISDGNQNKRNNGGALSEIKLNILKSARANFREPAICHCFRTTF